MYMNHVRNLKFNALLSKQYIRTCDAGLLFAIEFYAQCMPK